jgi:hypothetical protein
MIVIFLVILLILFLLVLFTSKEEKTSRGSTFVPIYSTDDVTTATTKFLGNYSLPSYAGAPYPNTGATTSATNGATSIDLLRTVLFSCPNTPTPSYSSQYIGPGQNTVTNCADSSYSNTSQFTEMGIPCSVVLNGQSYTFPLGIANWIAWANSSGTSWYGYPLSSQQTFNWQTSTIAPMAGPAWYGQAVPNHAVGTYNYAGTQSFSGTQVGTTAASIASRIAASLFAF